MASTITKKTCAKCDKGGGTAMCYGCEEAFCTKHFIEHRQELSQQMDNIGQEHNILRRDSTNEKTSHPMLVHINQWEEESIAKIKTTARSARIELQKLIDQTQMNLKESMNKMTNELQSQRESDDYTEIDITRWMDQLQMFRKMLDTPPNVQIDYERDPRAVIRLIKVHTQQLFDSSYQTFQENQSNTPTNRNFSSSDGERFSEIFGEIVLSENGLRAMHVGRDNRISGVSGVNRYSSGIHLIRIQIERTRSFRPFIGIVSSLEQLRRNILSSVSCYGWWDFGSRVVNGEAKDNFVKGTIQKVDQVDFTIDCKNETIQLEHLGTKTVERIQINPRLCLFPWKIVVLLYENGNSVRILS